MNIDKKYIYTVLLLIIFISMSSAAVDYEYKIRENINDINLPHEFFNSQLYISKVDNSSKAVVFNIVPMKDAQFFNLKIYHINLIPGSYEIFMKNNEDSWIKIEGLKSSYNFESFNNMKIEEFNNTDKFKIKLQINDYYIGIIQKIQLRYYKSLPLKKIEFGNNYEGVITEKNIIKARGFAPLSEDSGRNERIKQQRAAKITAFRNLSLLLKKIKQKENLVFDNTKFNSFVKGAQVIDKEYKDGGIYVTIGMKINGADGLSSIVINEKK